MSRYRKCQAQVHARRIALDRRFDEFFDFSEGDDFVEFALDLGFLHAEDGAIEVDVLAAGQLRVKAGADLEQAAHPPVDLRLAFGRLSDSRQQFEQRAFTGAVAPNHAQHLTLLDIE